MSWVYTYRLVDKRDGHLVIETSEPDRFIEVLNDIMSERGLEHTDERKRLLDNYTLTETQTMDEDDVWQWYYHRTR